MHTGTPFPSYIEFGLHDTVPVDVSMASVEVLTGGKNADVPAFIWFERMMHFVIREYLRRSFAPEVVKARELNVLEKARLQDVIQDLPDNVRESLRKLTTRTMRFLGFSIINPYAPNGEWADQVTTVMTLRDAGLIGTTDPTMAGSSWLKDREVGEAVGEFFFGQLENPFRGSELLRPKDWDEITAAIDNRKGSASPD